MYHVGKVLSVLSSGKDVISSDESIQAVLEMWDKNILTFTVDPKIAKAIRHDECVLVDYTPMSEKMPVPRHLIVKILKGKTADEVWKQYKKFFADKQMTATQQPMAPQYFG
jgi:hypothetical protein